MKFFEIFFFFIIFLKKGRKEGVEEEERRKRRKRKRARYSEAKLNFFQFIPLPTSELRTR